MKTIKINFVDFWSDFDFQKWRVFKILQNEYNVIVSENADYLFYSVYGYQHLRYDCIKIFFSAENVVPDFNFCDYGIGYSFLEFGDRYIRIPQFAGMPTYKNLQKPADLNPVTLLNRRFCNFLYSNSSTANPVREKFFKRLNEYKKVDSGGNFLNNTGHFVEDKLSFISGYKFTIAFENSSVEGYTTEKLVDPMSVQSLPVYRGNPLVAKDFNTDSFIRLKNDSEEEMNRVIEYIAHLDNHDDEYLEMLKKPWLNPSQFIDSAKRLTVFLKNIFDKPLEAAGRKPGFGYNRYYVNRLTQTVFKPSLYNRLKKWLLKWIG